MIAGHDDFLFLHCYVQKALLERLDGRYFNGNWGHCLRKLAFSYPFGNIMPELPEVETTKRALEPFIQGQKITAVWAKNDKLREVIVPEALAELNNLTIQNIQRKGKHLIIHTNQPEKALHVHLGMTGSLRICPSDEALGRHDYLSLSLSNQTHCRYADPRKFGLVALINPLQPPKTLAELGLEPLDYSAPELAEALFQKSRKTRTAVKTYIMNQKIVVGVGNIYATEALFTSKISPLRPANQVTADEYQKLAQEIQEILARAIEAGGTTIKDFQAPDGSQGYFFRQLQMYGQPRCPVCLCPTTHLMITGRTTTYCNQCQR